MAAGDDPLAVSSWMITEVLLAMPKSKRDEVFNRPPPAQELSEEAEATQLERAKHEATAGAMLEHVARHLRFDGLDGDAAEGRVGG